MGDFIDEIIRRETGGDPNGGYTNDPLDPGGRTIWGISERANPDLWKNGPPTYEQARGRYIERYLLPFEGVANTKLLHQLADWGVNSGPKTVVRYLQQLVETTADGVLGPVTLKKVNGYPDGHLFGVPVPGFVLLNLAVRDARTLFYATITKKKPSQLKWILGWLKRTFEFK